MIEIYLFRTSLKNCCIGALQGNKEKKDSWKLRKAALDEVEGACEQYRGLISTSSDAIMGLTELMRALNARLSDSQSNLKPIAARNIASILNSIDANSQPKLGKIVYGSLIKAGMSDNKNIVRDAAIEALQKGTILSEIDGGNVNVKSMEPLIAAFSTEVGDSEYKVRQIYFDGNALIHLNFVTYRTRIFRLLVYRIL